MVNIFNFFRRKEEVEPVGVKATIKMSDKAKADGLFDDENKIIEINRYGEIDRIKYSEADVDVLREQGIPVLPEDYTDEYDWLDSELMGGVETYKR